jgi:recombination protein RecT
MAESKSDLAVYKYEPMAQIGTKSNLKAMANLDPQTLSNLLPRDAPVKRLGAELVMAATTNPVILQCSQVSMARAITHAALTGLHIAGPMQQSAIIPRKKKGVYEACLDVMFKGLIALAHKSDKLRGIQVGAVYANDEYEIDLINGITHKPCVTGERGQNIGYYAILEMRDGAKQNTFMRADEVAAIKGRSSAARSGFSPWKSDPEQMGIKTVLKRALKNAPASTEETALAYAIAADNEAQGFDEYRVEGPKAEDILPDDSPATTEDGDVLPPEFQ